MSGPEVMRLFDREDETQAATEDLRQTLPSGAGTVRAGPGGNIVEVEVDLFQLQRVSPEAFTAQLTTAIQQLQERAMGQLRHRSQPDHRRRG